MSSYEYFDYEEVLKMLQNYSNPISENKSDAETALTQRHFDDLSDFDPASSNHSIDVGDGQLDDDNGPGDKNHQNDDIGFGDKNQIDKGSSGGGNQNQVGVGPVVGEKPFICLVCDRLFAKKCHLMCHMKAHLPPEEKEKLRLQRQEKMAGKRRRKLATERQLHSKKYEVDGGWVLCHICLKCFNNRDNHLVHARWHQFIRDNRNPFSGKNEVIQKNHEVLKKNREIPQSKDVEVARKKKKFPNLVPDSDKRSIFGQGRDQCQVRGQVQCKVREKVQGQVRDKYVVDDQKPGCSKYLY